MPDSFLEALGKNVQGLRVLSAEPMSAHCSFRIGGAARYFALPESEAQCAALLRFLHSAGITPIILGNGTNVLPPDEGLDAIVICTSQLGNVERTGDKTLRAQAGGSLAKTAAAAQSFALTGLEFAHGIPGTVGGGVFMNAGAYGGELKDVVTAVHALAPDGSKVDIPAEDMDFGYRHSALEGGDLLVTSVDFELEHGDKDAIAAKMRELIERRRASQPLDIPSAGSTFKRPQTGYAAALIDEAGLKGLSVGGAMVSKKHAGFIVNTGSATAADVRELMREVQEKVFRRSGVMLEPEVRVLRGATWNF